MHRHKIQTATKSLFKPLAGIFLNGLVRLERRIWSQARLQYSPIFIVAPPRSGTTLLYQVMSTHLSTCYFSNLAMRFGTKSSNSYVPVLGAQTVKTFHLHQNKSFKSYYGASSGWAGPHEGNEVWNQGFSSRPHHAVFVESLSPEAKQNIYCTVAGTEQIFKQPFVNKCINHSVRIQALVEIFPTAIFIQCVRNPVDIAQSIFIARTQEFPFQENNVSDPLKFWFSVKPREYELIKTKNLIGQVCEQVFYVEQSIAEARKILGEERFLSIRYENLCWAPHCEVDKIIKFMNSNNAPVHIVTPLPNSFRYSTGRKIDKETYVALGNYLDQLYRKEFD